MKKYLFLLNFFISIFFTKNFFASDCKVETPLKIGLLENEYIDYKYYLYYTLGDFSYKNFLEFDLSIVKNNVDEFDIIFGEYHELNKFTKNNISLPIIVEDFYHKNKISVENNILPLDLDTFIIASKKDHKKIYLEELSNITDPIYYSLGMSFLSKKNIYDLLLYNLDNQNIKMQDTSFESRINLFRNIYKNINKNLVEAKFSELFDSYENTENLFTLFQDGIIIYKDFNYGSFQIFPHSKYIWDDQNGTFINNTKFKPRSFFGFSAYINNTSQIGFLCFLIDNEVRMNSFKNFNIQLSPLSIKEVESFENQLPNNYLDLLEKKNDSIFNYNESNIDETYDLFYKSITNENKFKSTIRTNNYLN